MQETGTIQGLIRELERLAKQNRARRVVAVELVKSHEGTIDEKALRKQFRRRARGTVAEGAQFKIGKWDNAPYRALCLHFVELER